MSEYARQAQARKARLQRFAEAAARHVDQTRAQADAEQGRLLDKYLLRLSEQRPKRDILSSRAPLVQRILRAVALEYEVTIQEITEQNRHLEFTIPRFVAVGLMLEMTNLTLPAIGRRLGGRDNATIWHARSRIEGLLESEAFRNRFDQIKAEIEQ